MQSCFYYLEVKATKNTHLPHQNHHLVNRDDREFRLFTLNIGLLRRTFFLFFRVGLQHFRSCPGPVQLMVQVQSR
jgi:hypothetical protein